MITSMFSCCSLCFTDNQFVSTVSGLTFLSASLLYLHNASCIALLNSVVGCIVYQYLRLRLVLLALCRVQVLEDSPSGKTPLCYHIREVIVACVVCSLCFCGLLLCCCFSLVFCAIVSLGL